MIRLFVIRLIQLPLLLWLIYTVTFAMVWLVPGSPLDMEDRVVPKEVIQAMELRYHMDSPTNFYTTYLTQLVTKGDLGPSLRFQSRTVNEILIESMKPSLTLGAMAIIIALIIGVTCGAVAAVFRGGPLDWASMGLAMLGVSLPTFVTGTVLLSFFCFYLGWFDVGWGTPSQMILPAITLSLPFAAYIARLTRMGMLDTLNQDYIRTARAKGLPEAMVIFKHALKVAFLPVLSFLGPACAGAMTGSFVVEKVFNISGMGKTYISAVIDKDITLILGATLVYASMLIIFNMIVDLAYAWIDPRIDIQSGAVQS